METENKNESQLVIYMINSGQNHHDNSMTFSFVLGPEGIVE